MDNTAQNTQQPSQDSALQQPQVSPQPKPDDKIMVGQDQFVPAVSSLNKEKGGSAFSEIVKPSEQEVKVEEELKNVGIVANSDKPKLDEIHEQIGVKHSAESTPVPQTSSNKIVLPMSEEEADQTLKIKQTKFNLHENVGEFAGEYTEDSLPFLATLVKKIIKEMHRKLFRK